MSTGVNIFMLATLICSKEACMGWIWAVDLRYSPNLAYENESIKVKTVLFEWPGATVTPFFTKLNKTQMVYHISKLTHINWNGNKELLFKPIKDYCHSIQNVKITTHGNLNKKCYLFIFSNKHIGTCEQQTKA